MLCSVILSKLNHLNILLIINQQQTVLITYDVLQLVSIKAILLKRVFFFKHLRASCDIFDSNKRNIQKRSLEVFNERSISLQMLKVHCCRFENLLTSLPSHENNMTKISHYSTFYFLRYAHVR